MMRLGAAVGIAAILMCVAGVMASGDLAGLFVIGSVVCTIIAILVDSVSRARRTALQYQDPYDELGVQRRIGTYQQGIDGIGGFSVGHLGRGGHSGGFSGGHHGGESGHFGGFSGGHFDGGGGGHSGSH